MALSAAHNVLTPESWEAASSDDTADAVLRAHASPGRVLVRGPALRLKPTTVLAVAMTLRELCTNVTKYGALTQEPRGEVRILFEPEDVTCVIDAPLSPEQAEQLEIAA